MSSKEETYRRIHANTKPESWVFFRLWWSRHLLCKEIYLLMLLFYGIIMIISYQLLTWSPTRSFFKTSCGTLQPHPFNLVKLVNLKISIFENQSHTIFWMSVRVCTFVTSFSICLHYMMFQTIQTIYFLKGYHLVTTMTERKTYKKTNTNRQRQIQSASKTKCMLFF